MYMLWVAILLGIVEGLTEFLPISSTGHLIVTSAMLGFEGERAELFEIVIQLGAILSVVWEFRARLIRVATDLPKRPEARRFVGNLLVAFMPAAVVGLAVHDLISEHLFSVRTVAWALIAGAILIFVAEGRSLKETTREAEAVGWKQALGIGCFQCLALWPGFSRSAATILGGLLVGLSRTAATEFSFFLAIPVMVAASGLDLVKSYDVMSPSDWGWLGLCFVISFLVAWVSIKWLLRFVATHSFRPFAWYRIALGLILLLAVWRGWL